MIYSSRFPAGYPNGRLLTDDVVATTCATGDCLLQELSFIEVDKDFWPRRTANDVEKPLSDQWPFLAEKWPDEKPMPQSAAQHLALYHRRPGHPCDRVLGRGRDHPAAADMAVASAAAQACRDGVARDAPALVSSIGPAALRWLSPLRCCGRCRPARMTSGSSLRLSVRCRAMTVSVALRVGQDFVGDPVPYMADAIDAFFVRQDGDDETLFGVGSLASGQFPACVGNGDGNRGLQQRRLHYRIARRPLRSLSRAVWPGRHHIRALAARRGYASAARECFYRYAKALLTGAAPSASVTQPLALCL